MKEFDWEGFKNNNIYVEITNMEEGNDFLDKLYNYFNVEESDMIHNCIGFKHINFINFNNDYERLWDFKDNIDRTEYDKIVNWSEYMDDSNNLYVYVEKRRKINKWDKK